ncbi:flavodoxin [Erysipelotrichaceae bacterium RD49]|nr:flavodoxin [Erysipelotrichaceae bacterium RD49]
MSILVSYFSTGGVTANAAKKIAAVTGGRIFEIEPEIPYSFKDLDWMDSHSRSTLESKDPNAKVALKKLPNLIGVKTLFVGFPVWWYTCPKIIDTFLASLNLKGIQVIPFCTSGGTPLQTCEKKMKASNPGLDWKPGLRLTASTTLEQIRAWIDSLNLA